MLYLDATNTPTMLAVKWNIFSPTNPSQRELDAEYLNDFITRVATELANDTRELNMIKEQDDLDFLPIYTYRL